MSRASLLLVWLSSCAILVAPPASGQSPAGKEKPQAKKKTRREMGLSRLSPLQKQIALSTEAAAEWLSRMTTRGGLFLEGWYPALNKPQTGRHPILQAEAALALASAAAVYQDEQMTMRAMQALSYLLQGTIVDEKEPLLRRSSHLPLVVDPISFPALLALGLYELPEGPNETTAQARKKYYTQAEQLCNFLRTAQQKNGSIQLPAPAGKPLSKEAIRRADVSGCQAVVAILKSHNRQPKKWKIEIAQKALSHYEERWKKEPHRDFVVWYLCANAMVSLETKEKQSTKRTFEACEWLYEHQYLRVTDPGRALWLGAFLQKSTSDLKLKEPTCQCSNCAWAIVQACRVAQAEGDLARYRKYLGAVERCLQFLVTLQYNEFDTQHFAAWYQKRLVGGFRYSPTVGRLDLHGNQRAVLAFTDYLRHIAKLE